MLLSRTLFPQHSHLFSLHSIQRRSVIQKGALDCIAVHTILSPLVVMKNVRSSFIAYVTRRCCLNQKRQGLHIRPLSSVLFHVRTSMTSLFPPAIFTGGMMGRMDWRIPSTPRISSCSGYLPMKTSTYGDHPLAVKRNSRLQIGWQSSSTHMD